MQFEELYKVKPLTLYGSQVPTTLVTPTCVLGQTDNSITVCSTPKVR